MTHIRHALLITAAMLLGLNSGNASTDAPDHDGIVLTYHKVTGEPLDLRSAAELSDSVRRATNFDRPDAIQSEAARLQAQLAAASAAREFTLRINDSITQYDHDRGEFSVQLFSPGYYVPIQAFGHDYRLVFNNAESARAISMPKDQARGFDTQLNRIGRSVVNEVRFRVMGKGDPSGAVTGERVIQAEIVSDQLLDHSGHVVFAPQVHPYQAAPAAGSSFDAGQADIAGFRTGVSADDLAASLTRLYGPVTRTPPRKDAPWFGGAVELNPLGCIDMPGARRRPQPGSVCVTASYDHGGVVRSIRVERVFAWFDSEHLRKALVAKYGPVASAADSGNQLTLGWGADVNPALAYQRSGPHNALTAHYMANDDYLARSMNALPHIRVVLSLVDPQWASAMPR